MNLRPLGYEPNELPGCSTPRQKGARYRRRRKASSDMTASFQEVSFLTARPVPVRREGLVGNKLKGLWILAAILCSGIALAQEMPGDKGESASEKKLRNRPAVPRPVDIDVAATLDAMLAKKDKSAFSEAKGATVEGHVVQTEREEDGDYHLALASSAGETDTRKWVIAEVTPAWQKKAANLAPAALRKLQGKKVRVTGWLYYEPDDDQSDPRGTRWEIHPVTEITVAQ